MAARTRRVVWAESAQKALDEIIADVATDSESGAVRVLTVALETADSLSTLAERGRMVPEVKDPTLRELLSTVSLAKSASARSAMRTGGWMQRAAPAIAFVRGVLYSAEYFA